MPVCAFCSDAPGFKCPICAPVQTSGPIRKKGKRAPPSPYVSRPYTPPPVAATHNQARAQRIEENNRKIAALNTELKARAVTQISAPVWAIRPSATVDVLTFTKPTLPDSPRAMAKASGRPVPLTRVATVTPITNADWEAAASFTRACLRVPKQLEGTCRPTGIGGTVTRGDWAGLARAVDAGTITEATAIELAQSWKAVAS